MGKLRIAKDGIIMEGSAEFIKTIKAKFIMSRGVSSATIFYLAHVRSSFELHLVLCVRVWMFDVLWNFCLLFLFHYLIIQFFIYESQKKLIQCIV